MPTGDTLTVIGLALAAMIGALTTSGWRAQFLWVLTAASALLALAYAGALGSFGTSIAGAGELVTPLIAPVTIGIVALMLKGRRTQREMEPEPKGTEEPEGPAPPADALRPGLSNTKIEVWRARRDARIALAERRANVAGNTAAMESALASVRRTFAVETPAATGDARADLKLWEEYFEVVWPFLENGNYEEAKARAVRFLAERQPGQIIER